MFDEVMQLLEGLGSEQTRKTYGRHNVGGTNIFGVSFAEMRKLAKQIKKDHALALQLWATGNFEARVVATMIADPRQLTPDEAEAWVADCTGHSLADEVANNLLSKAPFGVEKAADWIDSPREFTGRIGWHLLAVAAKNSRDEIDYVGLLPKIEAEIHAAPNRKKEGMHNALMAFGIYRPEATEAALAAAKRIGKVEIDHGDTACKTHDAVPYIEKALARKR